MKLLLVFLMFAAHAFAEEATELPVWQSSDDQTYNDPNLSDEAFWYDNGDMSNDELLIQVYKAIGTGMGSMHKMTGAPIGQPTQGWRGGGYVGGGARGGPGMGGGGGMGRFVNGRQYTHCTDDMLSPTPRPGYVQTPRGMYRNPRYLVLPGTRMCSPK